MATKIVTKNSSTASAVPTASDLVQGELAVNVADKRLFTEDNAGAIVELGTNPTTLTVTGEITANGGIALGDSDKATFGDGDDLQIYHDGSASYIKDLGTGPLAINTNGSEIMLTGQSGSEYMVRAIQDGAVELYYDASKKLATTSTGIDVTGTATMDGLTVSNASGGNVAAFTNVSSADLSINLTGGVSLITPSTGVLAFGTSSTERMRIDSSGNVGIGTSSPVSLLTVGNNVTNATAISISTPFATNNYGDLVFTSEGTTTYNARIRATVPGDGTRELSFITAKSASENTVMTLDGDGNVGIGSATINTFYDTAVNVYGAGNSVIQFQSSNTGTASGDGFAVGVLNGAATDAYVWNRESSNLLFGTSGGERMRIDSSGNLLVGGTSDNPAGANVAGHALGASGYISTTRDGGFAAFLNRKTSDGEIVRFAKDGASVGSIGTLDGNSIYIGNGDVNLRMIDVTDDIRPVTSAGTNRDAAVDLGDANARFKDLYLSGIANIGTYLRFGGASNYYVHSDNANYLRFGTAGAERMRIDSSGNLLVGSSSTPSGSTDGTVIFASGTIAAYRTAAAPAVFSRNASNGGDVVVIQQQGTTVGSIGVQGSRPYFGNSINFSIKCDDANNGSLIPSNQSGVPNNNVSDIGLASNRWNDLYLGGGVYLGGTGAANKLDDYEEGTWTPALSFDVGGGSVAYTTQTGHYVKVGKTVSVTLLIEGINGVSHSDYYARLVLPFGTASTNQKIRTRVHNTGNTDFWVTTAGGTTPVMYASSVINDYARGDDLNGRSISATFTYETA